MTMGRYSRFAAVLTLAAGGFLIAAIAVAQDAPPDGDPMGNMIERLRQRGIDVSPEQLDRARRVMEDLRDGIPPDPNQLRQVFGDFRKQVEKQRQKRLQEELGATDEEWKVLGPKIEKVQTLRRLVGDDGAAGGPGRAMLVRNADPNTPPADIEKKSQTLQTLLSDKQAKPEAVTAALKAYRDARAKTKLDLAKARQELKDLLKVRQEAQLVTMGILD